MIEQIKFETDLLKTNITMARLALAEFNSVLANLKSILQETDIEFPGPDGLEYDREGALVIDDTEENFRQNRDQVK